MGITNVAEKLEAFQKKAEAMKVQRSKLEGEEASLEKRLKELDDKILSDTGVTVDGLPSLIKENEEKAQKYMEEIENKLGGK